MASFIFLSLRVIFRPLMLSLALIASAHGAYAFAEVHWLEAENAAAFPKEGFEIHQDPLAAENQYILVPNQDQFLAGPTGAVAEYPLSLTEEGTYLLWGRVLGRNGNEDSFYLQMDSGMWHLWDTTITTAWQWDVANSRGSADPVQFHLTAGTHILRIACREDGTQLDKLVLSDETGFTPTGLGQTAENLGIGIDNLRPTAPSALNAANVRATSFDLAWNAAADNVGIAGYWLDISLEANFASFVPGYHNKDLSGTTGTVISSLSAETTYFLRMRAYDAAGNFSAYSPALNVTTTLLTAEYHWIEAEYPVAMATAFKTIQDNASSQGRFIVVPDANQFYLAATGPEVVYPVMIREPGSYRIWGRVLAKNGNEDSFYLRVDNGPWYLWDTKISSSWIWHKATDRATGTISLNFEAGPHTIRIRAREDGTRLDKLLVSNDIRYGPVGLGLDAENLGASIDLEAPSVPAAFSVVEVKATSCAFSWQDATDNNGMLDYELSLAEDASFTLFNTNMELIPVGQQTTATVFNLDRNHHYFARVRAVDVAGNVSDWSEIASVTTAMTDPEFHWLEAEYPSFATEKFRAQADTSASHGRFISVPDAGGFFPSDTTEAVLYPFVISEPGSYWIWGRVIAKNGNEDSFYWQVDQGPVHLWDVEIGSSWLWDKTNSRGVSDPVKLSLAAGPHLLRIKAREDGAKLDKLLLSNQASFTPEGMGEPAENLPQSEQPVISSLLSGTGSDLITRYLDSDSLDVRVSSTGRGNEYAFTLGKLSRDFSEDPHWTLPDFGSQHGIIPLRAYARNLYGVSVIETRVAIFRQPLEA